jgi:hypothetical protein
MLLRRKTKLTNKIRKRDIKMKPLNLDNVKEAEDYEQLPAGGYIAKITNVEDEPNKEYLKIYFDIAEGDFKGHYQKIWENANFWAGNFIRSYKEKALPFFKSFTTAVESSNPNFKFNFDETTLKGKLVGIVLQEEEYRSNDGELKTKLSVQETRSVASIKSKEFKVKPKKTLNNTAPQAPANTIDNSPHTFEIKEDDIQF